MKKKEAVKLSDDYAARQTPQGTHVFAYFEDIDGSTHEDIHAGSVTLAKWDLVALARLFLKLDEILDEAIGLYLEFKDVHGYTSKGARDAAVMEILEGLDALEDIAAYEAEERDKA
jgi:hypothetical protein